MIKRWIIQTCVLTVLFSCGQVKKNESNDALPTETEENVNNDLKTIQLDFDFIVTVGQEEVLDNLTTYTYFQLTRNNTLIYIDSSLTEYEFGNKLFPIIIKTGENSFELLFEINNRPVKNYLKRLFIKENKLAGQDTLPTFETKPIDMNNDGIKEYAGYWDYPEVWGENNDLTAYYPILYYSVTTTGLKLDSILTQQRNKMIYGAFYGYSYNENAELKSSVTELFEQELQILNSRQ